MQHVATRIANFVVQPEIKCQKITTAHTKHLGNLQADIANQIIRKYKGNKKCKQVSNVNLIIPGKAGQTYPNLRFNPQTKTLYVSPLRLTLRWSPPLEYLKINQAEISQRYAYITVTLPDAPPTLRQLGVLGVDLNIKGNLATISNPKTQQSEFLGKDALYRRIKYKEMRRRFQRQGRESRVLAMGDHEARVTRDINHKLSRWMVEKAKEEGCLLAVENLSGIRKAKCCPGFRYFLNCWPFYQLRMMVEGKAQAAGIGACAVDPKYTSQLCSLCGERSKCQGKKYQCNHCGLEIHRDTNASYNIAKRGEAKMREDNPEWFKLRIQLKR